MPHAGLSRGGAGMSSSSGGRVAPRHAVLLRWGGVLSVLDLSRGAEVKLSDEVRPAGTCVTQRCWFNPVVAARCFGWLFV
jgi:hypothetical protein